MLEIKKGNTATLEFKLVDNSNQLLTNLASTTEIFFMVKVAKTDSDIDAVIIKKKTLGEIIVDDPSAGFVKVSLTATDTDITVKTYYMGLQLEFGAVINEIDTEDEFVITQDIIRG